MSTLWCYWGQSEMSFLRWMTLLSATKVHKDVALVIRKDPIQPEVRWKEKQDFQTSMLGHNWMLDVDSLPVRRFVLEEFAPEIAELNAPDIQTADLLAWWILANHGGTVADMDIVFLKPLPEIQKDVEVVIFQGHPQAGYVPVTFMQGRPCSIWRDAYQSALKSYDPNTYESCGTRAIVDRLKSGPAGEYFVLSPKIVFPWATKYPWNSWRDWLFETDKYPEIPDDCCGIHWYAGHNQRYNWAIRKPEDLRKGAVAWAIREVLKGESIGS